MQAVARALLFACLVACSDGAPKASIGELQNPETCKECHPKHYEQWSGSMHAYASDDPVFVAMNARGQRETDGKLGDFCVACHAPMAVALGATNGVNFDPAALSASTRGITCYFCHNVESVEGIHNNPLQLAMDQTMRGGAKDATSNPAHHSKYDKRMDSGKNESEICGACHDIVVPEALNGVPGGVELERTFAEWKTTFYATNKDPAFHQTCGDCHMRSKTDTIADFDGVELRTDGFHEHAWPGVDQALTPFPGVVEQAALIERDVKGAVSIIGALDPSGDRPGGICVTPDQLGTITVRLDNANPGHAMPSGAAQDRRMWVEVKAFDAANQIVFASGVVPPGTDPPDDPGVFGLWDRTFKHDGTPAHFFWEVASVDSRSLLPSPVSPGSNHAIDFAYRVPGLASSIDRVETRVFLRALPYEMIDDLIASGDLAPAIRDQVPTLEITAGRRIWRRSTRDGDGCCSVSDKCKP